MMPTSLSTDSSTVTPTTTTESYICGSNSRASTINATLFLLIMAYIILVVCSVIMIEDTWSPEPILVFTVTIGVQTVLCLVAIEGERTWPVRVLWVWVTIVLLIDFIAMYHAPPSPEPIVVVMATMAVQIVLCLLAIWGARTYRGWPVRVLWVWVTIRLLFDFIAMFMMLVDFDPSFMIRNWYLDLGRNWYLILGCILEISVYVPLIWYPLYGYLNEWPQLEEAAAGTTPSFTTAEGEPYKLEVTPTRRKNREGYESGIELV